MNRRTSLALLAALALSAPAVAQNRTPQPPPQPAQAVVPVYQTAPDADSTRQQFHALLEQFPPNLSQVLRLDHSLLTRADYVGAYPQLVAFLQQHPEIARNPEFFLGSYSYERQKPLPPELEAIGAMMAVLGIFVGVSAFLGVLIWLVRAVIQHRRWLVTSKAQAEIHTKLMDRMTTNEELMAYVQSPAGRRFLESAPIQTETETPRISAPVGSIVWSMMAGIVLAAAGSGLKIASSSVTDEAQQALNVIGIIILTLGAGFIIASAMAYLVSSRLGLFPQRVTADSSHA